MANFIFNQGAALAAGAGLDWVSTAYEIAVYDNTVTPAKTSVWADLSSGVVASQVIPARALTTYGACSGDPVVFNSISPTAVDGYLVGLLIKRQSDNLLVAHIDSGLAGLNIQAPALTYTFTVVPGANTEQAYFRL